MAGVRGQSLVFPYYIEKVSIIKNLIWQKVRIELYPYILVAVGADMDGGPQAASRLYRADQQEKDEGDRRSPGNQRGPAFSGIGQAPF